MNNALGPFKMSNEVQQAYKWAKHQQSRSVAAKHARTLAKYVEQTELCVKFWNEARIADRLQFLRFNND